MFLNSQSLLSSGIPFWELGSQMVMPQSMSSRSGNWAVANWMPPENYRPTLQWTKAVWKQRLPNKGLKMYIGFNNKLDENPQMGNYLK